MRKIKLAERGHGLAKVLDDLAHELTGACMIERGAGAIVVIDPEVPFNREGRPVYVEIKPAQLYKLFTRLIVALDTASDEIRDRVDQQVPCRKCGGSLVFSEGERGDMSVGLADTPPGLWCEKCDEYTVWLPSEA